MPGDGYEHNILVCPGSTLSTLIVLYRSPKPATKSVFNMRETKQPSQGQKARAVDTATPVHAQRVSLKHGMVASQSCAIPKPSFDKTILQQTIPQHNT